MKWIHQYHATNSPCRPRSRWWQEFVQRDIVAVKVTGEAATLDGLGLASVFEEDGADDLERGDLVRVLEG